MCGIAGIHRRTGENLPRLGQLTDALLLAIENRGRDATGLLSMLDDGKVQLQRKVVPATRFVRQRQAMRADARTVLLHTRFATVGSPADVRNAHPQLSERMAAVHNGTIYNAGELFKTFRLKRRAAVDSEIIPALIQHAGWQQAADAVDLFEGGAAFAAVHADHPDELLLGRTQHFPLVYYVSEPFVAWASTRTALAAGLHALGRACPAGEFGQLDEWSLLRCTPQGLHIERVRKPKPKPKPPTPTRSTATGPAVSKRQKRKARKAARASGQAQLWAPVLDEREAWMDEAVRDVMRQLDCDYGDAYEAVYGICAPDTDWRWDGDDMTWGL